MNKVILLGRLTKDPMQGNNNCKFTVAVNRIKKGEADFISCVAFGKTSEVIMQYMQKGSQIALDGHIQTGSYTDKTGQTKYTTDVIVDRMEFVGGTQQQEQQNNSQSLDSHLKNVLGDELEEIDGDIPF